MKPRRHEQVDADVPPQWSRAVVNDSLHCRGCGYDLRGLPADGKCPECGLEIWSTVLSTVDPSGSRMPSLRNPPAVGDAMVLLTAVMLVGALLLATPSLTALLDSWDAARNARWSQYIPTLGWPAAAILGGVGLWALWLLAPPRGSERGGAVWTDIGRVAAGLLGWLTFGATWVALSEQTAARSAAAASLSPLILHLAAVGFAAIGLIGLRGVFGVIGLRSREYRRSRGGRQNVELIIVATCATWLAAFAGHLTYASWFPGPWRYDVRTIATIVQWMSMLMVVIGLAYLVMNAWWIRRALRRPPPHLDQVLMPALPPDTWIPDREE